MVSKSTKYYNHKRVILEFEYGYFCNNCQKRRKKMDFAHIRKTMIKGTNRPSWVRQFDLKMFPESYILLCRKCHIKMDNYGL